VTDSAGDRDHAQRNLPGHQIEDCGTCTAVRHVHDIDLRKLLEDFG